MLDSEIGSELQNKSTKSGFLHFSKMHALGNDFVVMAEDELASALSGIGIQEDREGRLLERLAQRICARQFFVGADGLIVVRRGSTAERLSWSYLNSDGSSSLMCGNGLRCLALWAKANNWAPSDKYYVETGKGPVEISFANDEEITSDLGEPILEPDLVPVRNKDDKETLILQKEFNLKYPARNLKITCLSMGNPHCVIFEDSDFDAQRLSHTAAQLQSDEFFPEGVNVEFVKVNSPEHMTVLVYERGCGRTLACASGAAATLVAAVLSGLCQRQALIQLEGGSLKVSWDEKDNHVRITGPATLVYTGSLDLRSLKLGAQTW